MGVVCSKRSTAALCAPCSEEAPAPVWPWTHALAVHDQIQLPSPPLVELPVEILPHVFLGDVNSARCLERLKELGITHVLNVAGKATANVDINYLEHGIEHFDIEADDEEGYPMLPWHLESARAFIQRSVKAGGSCLVHCRAGVNRSGVLVAAELMLRERIPVLEAVKRCREVRGLPFLNNRSFQHQLVKLAEQHHLLGPRPAQFDDRLGCTPPPPPPRATVKRQKHHIAAASSPTFSLQHLEGIETTTSAIGAAAFTTLPTLPLFPTSPCALDEICLKLEF